MTGKLNCNMLLSSYHHRRFSVKTHIGIKGFWPSARVETTTGDAVRQERDGEPSRIGYH